MIEIPLTQGQVAMIDDEDFEIVSKYKWFVLYNKGTKSFYAITHIKKQDGQRTTTLMHRLIMSAKLGECVDHKNHKTLDNRRSNLRLCNHSENNRNSSRKPNESGFRGVSLHKRTNKWMARIRFNGKAKNLGYFDSPEDAYKAYCNAANIWHGEFSYLASLSFPDIL